MALGKLRWYAARLAAMSPAEVAHRVQELAKKKAWSRDRKGWETFAAVPDGPIAPFPLLRQRLAAAWPLAAAGYAHLNEGRFSGLGRQVSESLGDRLWFVDPVKGGFWPGPEAYCFSVDVRSTGETRGDVKYVWEINRLQMLHPLASAIAADPREDIVERAFAILKSWRDANPPYRGVNWFSGIELAMRLVSLTLVAAALPPEAWTGPRRRLVRELVAAHAFWLHRYPSKYSSANNHLVAEGLGLFLAGLLAPDLPHALEYGAEGRRILEQEALLQILPDGVGAEQSPTYQAFTMEMLAFAALLAEMSGRPLQPAAHERLRAGAFFLQSMMDGAGAVPAFGDDDEGRVIACPPDREPRYVASVAASVAGLLGDASILPPGRAPHLREVLFAAPADSARPVEGLRQFPAGGWSIARESIGGRLGVLAFDHAPLGYLKLAAHGHADALALWLSVDDIPVFVDAGTYLYHSGGPLRSALRSSAAHNTLTIEETSQSLPSAAFSWASRAVAKLEETREGRWWSVTASHDGYYRRYGARHRRILTRTPTGFSVTDSVHGAERPLDCEIGFLVHPEVQILREGARFVLLARGERIVEIAPPVRLNARIVRNDRITGAGLYSPRFGEVGIASRLVFSGAMDAEPVITRIDIVPKG